MRARGEVPCTEAAAAGIRSALTALGDKPVDVLISTNAIQGMYSYLQGKTWDSRPGIDRATAYPQATGGAANEIFLHNRNVRASEVLANKTDYVARTVDKACASFGYPAQFAETVTPTPTPTHVPDPTPTGRQPFPDHPGVWNPVDGQGAVLDWNGHLPIAINASDVVVYNHIRWTAWNAKHAVGTGVANTTGSSYPVTLEATKPTQTACGFYFLQMNYHVTGAKDPTADGIDRSGSQDLFLPDICP